MKSGEDTLNDCVTVFPQFREYWNTKGIYDREADGSFTACGVFMVLTWLIWEQWRDFTANQWRQFATLAKDYFDKGEPIRGMLGACLIEHLSYKDFSHKVLKYFDRELLQNYCFHGAEGRATPAPKKKLGRQPKVPILELYEPPENTRREICKNPDPAVIDKTVKDQEWSDITFVMVKFDDNNWIEGSGSLNPRDGLSARYSKDGEEHISSRPPKSLEEIIALLQSFRSGDGRWQKMIDWD